MEVNRHTLLSDRMALIFYELKKLPPGIDKDNRLLLWLALFNADTEEELTLLQETGVVEMEQAIEAYNTIISSDEFIEYYRMLDTYDHDTAQRIKNVKDQLNEEWQEKVAEKDAEIASITAENDAKIADITAENDIKIANITAEKDAEIARSIALLAEKDPAEAAHYAKLYLK